MTSAFHDRWDLVSDGDPILTHHAALWPVRQAGRAAMLKLTDNEDEQRGAAVLAWWNGDGAAPILRREGPALLMARAEGGRSLAAMARTGDDDAAARILCETAARLHRQRPDPPPATLPLADMFRDLAEARGHGGILSRADRAATALLAEPQEQVVLHGDLHHDNVLDFGPQGWLAIDPKGLWGERGFDYANIFTNPDLADPSRPVATQPGVFQRRVALVAAAAQIERRRLLQWVLAWCGLSAVWFMGDHNPMAGIDLHIAMLAAAALDG